MVLSQLAGLMAPPADDSSPTLAGPAPAHLPITDAVRRELEVYDARRAATPDGTTLLQELLTVTAGIPTDVDGDKGPQTIGNLKTFQRRMGFTSLGAFDEPTFRALVKPIHDACQLPASGGPSGASAPNSALNPRGAVVAAARQHAAAKAREVSPNSGPWVRLYMAGNQGRAWAWCAGFASFVWIQAAAALVAAGGAPALLDLARRYRSFSCDVIATRAKADGRFIEGAEVAAGRAAVLPGDLFLVQASANDWVHVGVVVGVRDGRTILTVEGNTNAAGGREGLFVLARERRVPTTRNSGLDFVRCPLATPAGAAAGVSANTGRPAARPAAPATDR